METYPILFYGIDVFRKGWLLYVKVRWKKTCLHGRGILCSIHADVRVI